MPADCAFLSKHAGLDELLLHLTEFQLCVQMGHTPASESIGTN